jgi:metalloendopeptidase OMA1, mitochondrial
MRLGENPGGAFVVQVMPRALRVCLLVCAAVVCGLAIPGCGEGPLGQGQGEGEGPGHRYQNIALSAQQEVKLGDEAFQEVLAKEHPVRGPEVQRVEAIAEKIFHQALDNQPLRREIGLRDVDAFGSRWDFDHRKYAVLDEKEINAFCLPGGKIAVFQGLMEMTKGNDPWLATVLGHEISHALAHHSSERIARQNMYAQAGNASVSGFGLLDNDDHWRLMDLLGVGLHAAEYAHPSQPEPEEREERRPGLFAQFREMSFDRQQESEADHIGVFLMAFAGYDPNQAVGFWQAMEERSGNQKIPEILSDHPSDAHRVAMMKQWAVRANDAVQAWKSVAH